MRTTRRGVGVLTHLVLVGVPIAVAVAVGCSSASDDEGGAATTATVPDVVIEAGDFKPLAEMTPVRGFFVDNVAGDLDATLAVANDPEGGGAFPWGP